MIKNILLLMSFLIPLVGSAYGLSIVATIKDPQNPGGGHPSITIYHAPVGPGQTSVVIDRCTYQIDNPGTLFVTLDATDPPTDVEINFDQTRLHYYTPTSFTLNLSGQVAMNVQYDTDIHYFCHGSIKLTISNTGKSVGRN